MPVKRTLPNWPHWTNPVGADLASHVLESTRDHLGAKKNYVIASNVLALEKYGREAILRQDALKIQSDANKKATWLRSLREARGLDYFEEDDGGF